MKFIKKLTLFFIFAFICLLNINPGTIKLTKDIGVLTYVFTDDNSETEIGTVFGGGFGLINPKLLKSLNSDQKAFRKIKSVPGHFWGGIVGLSFDA